MEFVASLPFLGILLLACLCFFLFGVWGHILLWNGDKSRPITERWKRWTLGITGGLGIVVAVILFRETLHVQAVVKATNPTATEAKNLADNLAERVGKLETNSTRLNKEGRLRGEQISLNRSVVKSLIEQHLNAQRLSHIIEKELVASECLSDGMNSKGLLRWWSNSNWPCAASLNELWRVSIAVDLSANKGILEDSLERKLGVSVIRDNAITTNETEPYCKTSRANNPALTILYPDPTPRELVCMIREVVEADSDVKISSAVQVSWFRENALSTAPLDLIQVGVGLDCHFKDFDPPKLNWDTLCGDSYDDLSFIEEIEDSLGKSSLVPTRLDDQTSEMTTESK